MTLVPDGAGAHDGTLRYLPPDGARLPGRSLPTLRASWAGLPVATVQNGRAQLSVRRNEHLVPGVPTRDPFVMTTPLVTAPDVATPVLAWNDELPLSGATLAAAVAAALGELFGPLAQAPPDAPPVTIQLAYGHELIAPDPGQRRRGDAQLAAGRAVAQPAALLHARDRGRRRGGRLAESGQTESRRCRVGSVADALVEPPAARQPPAADARAARVGAGPINSSFSIGFIWNTDGNSVGMPTDDDFSAAGEPADDTVPAISRRRFAGLLGATGAGVAAAMAPAWTPANALRERPFQPRHHGGGRLPQPNLLVILADDLGWADLSSYGAPDDQNAEHRPPRRLRRPLHRRLLGLGRLLADAASASTPAATPVGCRAA